MSSEKAIGVFDTGVGGLSVVREVQKLLPQERIIYFADRARQPYGALPQHIAERLVLESLDFLVKQDVKILVIACNTAAAAGYEAALNSFSLPIVSVIEPGVREAARVTKNKRVGLIGTKGTVESNAHTKLFARIDSEIEIFTQSCPLLPPLIELGKLDTPETQLIIQEYLNPLIKEKVDTLILGCTHFPFVRPLIEENLGIDVSIVDPALETARQLKQILEEANHLGVSKDPPEHRFFVSKFPSTFQKVGSLLLGMHIPKIEECQVGEPVKGFEIIEKDMYHPGNEI